MDEEEAEYLQDGRPNLAIDGPIVELQIVESYNILGSAGEQKSYNTQSESVDVLGDITHYPGLRRSSRQRAGDPPERLCFDNVCLVTESLLHVESPFVPFSLK